MTEGPVSDQPSWPGAQHQHTGPEGQLASTGAWLGLGPWPAPEVQQDSWVAAARKCSFSPPAPAYVPSTNHAAWSAWPQRRQASVCLGADAKLGEQNQQSVSPGLRRSGSVFSCDSIRPGLGRSPIFAACPQTTNNGTSGADAPLTARWQREGWGLGSAAPPGPLPCNPVHAAFVQGPLRSSRPRHRPLAPRLEKHGNGSTWKPALSFFCFWTDV